MIKKTVRKAVYIPSILWECLAEDASKEYDTVTGVLKNALLPKYAERIAAKEAKIAKSTKHFDTSAPLLDESGEVIF